VSGAVLIEGGELLAQTGRPASELWLDGVHPTVLGHRVLGRALAGQLRRWIRGGSAGGKSRGGALPDYRVPTTESE
jgi:lysophospholipase L1-like esterase